MQTLIPSARFGAVLSSSRQALGLDVVDLARQSGGSFTATQLSDAERGRIPEDDATRAALAALYQLDANETFPKRSELIVDLEGRQLAVGDRSVVVRSDEVDHVLQRYLSLLYLLRDTRPGTELSLRDPDLDLLSRSLEIELAALERRLGELMVGEDVPRLLSRLRSRLLLPAAGVLVTASAIGYFVIVGRPTQGVEPVAATGHVATMVAPATSVPTTTASAATAVSAVDPPAEDTVDVAGQSVEMWAGYHARALAAEGAVTSTAADMGTSPRTAIEREPAVEIAPVEIAAVEEAASPADGDPGTSPSTPTDLGTQALALIAYDWQSALPGWVVSFAGATDADTRGMTFPRDKSIVIYVQPGDAPQRLSEIVAHELGHALDVEHLDDDARVAWLTARGKPMVWWAGSGLTDFEVGAGDFAEAVAAEWTGSTSRSGEFSQAHLELVRQLLP